MGSVVVELGMGRTHRLEDHHHGQRLEAAHGVSVARGTQVGQAAT